MADSKPTGASPITITQQGSAVVISDGTRTVRSYYATDRMAKRMVSTLQKRSEIAKRWLQVCPVQLELPIPKP